MLTTQSLKDLWIYLTTKRPQEQDHIMIGDLSYDRSPTELNKPSNHSSLTQNELLKLIKGGIGYNQSRFKIFGVTNTNSMEPWMDDNCKLIVEKITPKVLEKQPIVVGDVVIYETTINNKLQYVIHRVIRLSQRGISFYIRGDNNKFNDKLVKINQIKYRMVAIYYGKQIRSGD